MRAASAFMAGVGSAAIVALGWQAGVGTLVQALPQSQAAASGTDQSVSSGTSTTSTSPSASPSASATSSGTSSSSNSSSQSNSSSASTDTSGSSTSGSAVADGTYTGSAVQTRFGTVQVQVVFSQGVISDVVAIQANATHGRQQAFPLLREEALSAQSANISNISGATYTTMGYQQSLQSALDAAGYTG